MEGKPVYSPRFGYVLTKKLDGVNEGGSTGWWSHRVHKVYGSCREELCPTDTTKNLTTEEYRNFPITNEMLRDAYTRRSSYYQRLYSIEECVYAIYKIGAIGIDFDCFASIRDSKDGNVKLPEIGEKRIGGHSVAASGYDQNKRFFHFVNSWGEKWGDKGFGYLPFDYFDQGLIISAWATGIRTPEDESEIYDLQTQGGVRKFKVERIIYPSLRNAEGSLTVFDIYSPEGRRIGHLHISPISETDLEIEDFFILPEYQGKGFGSATFDLARNSARETGFKKMVGWIGAQDLVAGREKNVKKFFHRKGFTFKEDDSKFRDAVYRVDLVI